MAAKKSNKQSEVKTTDGPMAAISVHPRAARMQRLGTYELQKPGFHFHDNLSVAAASAKAKEEMAKERGEEVVPESQLAPEVQESRQSGMTDTVSGDVLRLEEKNKKAAAGKSKSQERREAAMKAEKKESEKATKSKPSDKTVTPPQVDAKTESSEKKESVTLSKNSSKDDVLAYAAEHNIEMPEGLTRDQMLEVVATAEKK